MNRTTTPSTERRPSVWHETSLNSKAFSVMLSSIFVLTLSAAAIGWSGAQAATETSGAASPVVVPAPPPPEGSDRQQAESDRKHSSVRARHLNGMSVNGMSVNGMSVNGMSVNGIAVNGIMTNGARASAGQVESVLLVDGEEILLR